MITEYIAVYIASKEEAREVIDYYRAEYGYHTQGLTLNNCQSYPYLFLNNSVERGLLSGRGSSDNFHIVLSFLEWKDAIDASDIQPIENGAIELLFGGDGD